MQKTLRRIKAIRKICGDLCDTSKEINPGEFLGSVTSKVMIFDNGHKSNIKKIMVHFGHIGLKQMNQTNF